MPRPLRTPALRLALATALLGALTTGTSPALGHGGDRLPAPGRPQVVATALGTVTSLAVRDRHTVAVTRRFPDSVVLVRRGVATVLPEAPVPPGKEILAPFVLTGAAWHRGRLLYASTGQFREIDDTVLLARARTGTHSIVADIGESGHEGRENGDGAHLYGYVDGLEPGCANQILVENPWEQHGVTYHGDLDSGDVSTAARRGTVYVADADANAVLAIDGGGVRTVAVLPPVVAPMTAQSQPSQENIPACALGHRYAFEAYPSDVEVGRDGRLLVTTLPEASRGADLRPLGSLLQIHPRTGRTTILATGLARPVDLAVGSRGEVYVAEASRISVLARGATSVRTWLDVPDVTALERHGQALYATTGDGRLLRIALRR